MLLQVAFEVFAAPLDNNQIIIGEFTPLLLGLTFNFFSISFYTVPIHEDLHYIFRQAEMRDLKCKP
jgi:hypothetical protein